MPNTYIKAAKYAALAVAALERDVVLPNIVTPFDGRAFVGAEDDTVTFRLPGVTIARDYDWRTRVNPIIVDKIARTKVAIVLDTHTYSANAITDEELTLDIESFQTDVVFPQTDALRNKLESKVINKLAAANFKVTNLNAVTADDPYVFALKARSVLNGQGTPGGRRVLLVGSNVEPWILNSQAVQKSDPTAAKNAYQEAVFGRMAGFDILSSALIGANAIYALHPSWAVLANVAPDVPQGVSYGAKVAFRGYGLRVIRDYDTNYLRDRSVVNTFTGISEVQDEYAFYTTANLTDGGGGTSTIPDGYSVGDIKITDGAPVLTGKNVRGARGTFTP